MKTKKPDFPLNYNGHVPFTVIGGKPVSFLIARIPLYTFLEQGTPEFDESKQAFESQLEAEYLEAKQIYDSLQIGVECSSASDFPADRSIKITRFTEADETVFICLAASKRHKQWVDEQNRQSRLKHPDKPHWWTNYKPIKSIRFNIVQFIGLVKSKQLYINADIHEHTC